MKKIFFLIAILFFVSCKNKSEQSQYPMRDLLNPQIAVAYENEDWGKVVLLSDSLIRTGEPCDDLTLCYANALTKTGDINKSIEVLQKEINNKKGVIRKYYLYNELGYAYRMKKEYEKGISAYKQSLELSSSYVRPMIGLAELYEETGDTVSALRYYFQASALLFEHNRKDELHAVAREMMNLAPNDINSLQIMGRAYQLIGDYRNEELCLLHQIHILLDGKDCLDDDNFESFAHCVIALAVAQYNQDKYDECMESIKWLRENVQSLNKWEKDIQRLEEQCRKGIARTKS